MPSPSSTSPLTLRRLLVPTDDSPCADRAWAHAVWLAECHGADLHVLRVQTDALPPEVPTPFAPGGLAPPDAVRCLHTLRKTASAAEAIVDAAREADLVVMGTHGRQGLTRLALGSTTEAVLRHADCPVLAVGPEAGHATPDAVARLLVPVDFSESSERAVALADALAGVYGGRVDLLHAVFLPSLPEIYGFGLQFGTAYPDVIASSEDALATMAREALDPARRGEVLVRVGPPVPTILDEAAQQPTGLLVMSTHGRTGLSRLALGSVAESVLRRAPCAVLALPSFGRLPLLA